MKKISYPLWIGTLLLCACGKDFLEKRSDKALLVPQTLADMQALLDNSTANVMNYDPGLLQFSSDDFLTTEAGLATTSLPAERNAYLWAKDIFEGQSLTPDWDIPYKQVLYANVVMEGLQKISPKYNEQQLWDNLRGAALFYRSLAFYNLAQSFAAPYDTATAESKPGIPLKLSAGVNEAVERGTLKQTYGRILADLKTAIALLPRTAAYNSRPDRAAAWGLLARVQLVMEDYTAAGMAADSALEAGAELLDFKTLNEQLSTPLPSSALAPAEVLYHSSPVSYSFLASSLTMSNPTVIASYAPNDLRKDFFFKLRTNGVYSFRGYRGLSTGELYLDKAEVLARAGAVQEAMAWLNALLEHRFRDHTLVPLTATDATEALDLVLQERRKELIGKGTRWADLRRLNKDSRFAITLTRQIDGLTYTLAPNDVRYVLPIPDAQIRESGIAQNPR